MTIRIASLLHDSIVDGPGLRYVVFAQGCPHRCPGCHNPHTHDPDGGTAMSADAIIADMCGNPLTDGLTLSGGEPFVQAAALLPVAEAARRKGLSVWIFTGYTWEELSSWPPDGREAVAALLCTADVVVDGRYEAARRTLNLPFRGSANQRLIDAPASLAAGRVVLWAPTGA